MKEVEDYAEVATKEVVVDENAQPVVEAVVEEKKEEVKTEVKAEEKTEAKKEEKKEEPKEVKAEKKEAAPKKGSKKSLFERFDKPEETKQPEVKEEAVVNEYQSKYEQLLAEHEELKSKATQDNSGKSVIEKLFEGKLDITDKDLKALLKSAAGVDYSHLPTEQLIEQSIKTDPDFESLTDEEKESELSGAAEKFETMSALEKKKYRNELLSKMNKSPEDSEVLKALTEIQNNQKQALKDPEKWFEEKATENFNATFEAATKDFDTLADSVVGQKLDGYELTADHAKAMKDWFREDVSNLNLENRLETILMAITAEDRIAAAYERGKTEGKIKQANPGKGIVTNNIAAKEGSVKKLSVEDY